ncbi:MAG: GGDEF domain-containing protein, partial [Epsilonproteobacteria bacterium]
FAFILAFVLYFMTRKEFLKIYTRVQKYALTDALTGLKNRYFLIDYFETFAKDSEDDTEFSVVVINIDYFRKVNEAYGYVVGDCILKELSKKLTLLVEPKDIVCRYAGEEFVIVFENIGLPEIFDKVEFIREEIQNMIFECERKNITVSIGISVSRQKPKISQKLQEADLALYMAKKDGRNCVKVFPN